MDVRELDLDALLRGARAELADEPSARVAHLVELHRRGTREIFERAVDACASAAPDERLLGVRILRELGGPPPAFADDAVPVLVAMVADEPSSEVLRWIVSALGYQHHTGHLRARLAPSPAAVAAMLRCARHDDDRVRFAVAAALPSLVDLGSPDPKAVRALIELAGDRDADTRYYALAGLVDDLGLAAHADVREVLAQHVTDLDAQIRRAARRALDGGTWSE